ncbi:Ig-like domain-containing protein [Azospirillum oleiclasticum]|uniref:Ig-like domain-containing protein n=1 Tax=Azospirillum oleiclasticum TaxID=2735135 RepID=UPI0015D4734E
MSIFGVYVGNSPAAVNDFETWMDRPVDAILAYVGRNNWADFTGSASWAVQLWANIDRPVLWSVPLIVNNSSLDAAAHGDYNAYYRQVAQSLAASRPQDPLIYVRTGWEFNGQWFPWKAAGKEEAYIGAYRQFVDSFRGVSDRFRFDWSPNIGDLGMDPAAAYPGDAYVDVISLDFYHNTAYDPRDPATAWNYQVNRPYGLRWHQEFAAAHGKPTAYSEWGVSTNDAAPYVQAAADWFAAHDVLYHAYWDSNADYPGKLSDGRNPATGAVFRQEFGVDSDHAVIGTDGPDLLYGTDGNDHIDGRGGADTMAGGAGNDSYVVDRGDDVIIELAGGGIDGVRSHAAAYTLPDHVENLTLMGPGGQAGAGNALDNRIIGGAGDDLIDGGAGNDFLMGGVGNDRFIMHRGTGRDTIADFQAGAGAGDVLVLDGYGLSGFDQVRARLEAYGSDSILALPGGDVVVFRGLAPGAFAADDVAFTGAPPAPRPVWFPEAPEPPPTGVQYSRTGTGGNDTLTGDDRNDFLDGSGGADTLIGGRGHDVYVVDQAGDVIVERPGEGIDSVQSWSRSYTLPDHVEHLSLLATYAQTGIGNALANRITGGAGNDTLIGGAGDDWLTGRGGNDLFVFQPGAGHDVVTDFNAGPGAGDQVRLDGYGLAGFAAVRAAMSAVGEGTVLTLPNGDTVLFQGVSPDRFAMDDFAFAAAANRAPTVGSNRSLSVAAGAGATALGLAQPTDPDGDALTIAVSALPAGGSVRFADGRVVVGGTIAVSDLPGLTFTPNPGFTGDAGVFSYVASDGRGGSAAQALRLSVGTPSPPPADFDPLAYTAGYADLSAAFGTNAAAATQHYLTNGRAEGRRIDLFNPASYMAVNPDVATAFGFDPSGAAAHYIVNGRGEGRVTGGVDMLEYTAGYADLRQAFGTNETAAVRHYLTYGKAEGRTDRFDGLAYVASYTDLAAAFGPDDRAGARHFIGMGAAEGRTVVFDPNSYLAANTDLLAAFGGDRDAASRHYLQFGRSEGRGTTFAAAGYLAANADVASAFGGDTAMAAWHYVHHGRSEGRALAPA